MQTFLSLLVIPIAILNFAGGIVGGIWLAILGEWSLIGSGIVAVISSTFILGLALMPGMLFLAPAALALKKQHLIVGTFLGAIAALWTNIVIVVWCVISFGYIVGQHRAGSIWPYLLWGYSVATGPWAYMASRESQADPESPSSITAFFACFGGVAMIALHFLVHRPTITAMGIAFIIPMSISFLFQITMFVLMARAK